MIDRTHMAVTGSEAVVAAAGLLAPFNDAGVLNPLDVHAATVIARLCGETDQRVILAAALTVRGTRFGHVCIRLANQREGVVVDGQDPATIDALPWPDEDGWQAVVAHSAIVGDGSGGEPMVLVDDRLYLDRYFRYEEAIVGLFEARIGAAPATLDAATRAALDQMLPPLVEGRPNRQQAAVAAALGGKLTVIAGGPGTGKTYTVAALLATLARRSERQFPLVALCAPTGKAAARLSEELGEFAAQSDNPAVQAALGGLEASTIHRLLGWTWGRGRFRHHQHNRLPHDLVIVDEMSMVSLPLAAKLMAAVRDEAAVVLVGDPFQLESIEAGTVLSDIVGPAADESADDSASAPISRHVVVLDRVHRFDESGSIADFAEAVRQGDADRAMGLLEGEPEGLVWVGDRSGTGFEMLWERVTEHRSRLVEIASVPGNEEAALASLGELAVLCAHRDGPGGVAQWRRDIENELDERFTGLRYRSEWYPGRPIMITSNDYTLDLYNGDIGVVVRTDEGLRAVFERGGIRVFHLGRLGEHTSVHAMTIHKSQGSQFAEVVVSLPVETSRILTRELLYTAVTRASTRVTVIGDEAAIRSAIQRSVQRASGLGRRLWG